MYRRSLKHPLLLSASFSLALPLLSGCSGMQEQIDRLDSAVDDIRSIQAEHSQQIVAAQQDVRTLRGRLEELEYAQSKRIGSEVDVLKSQISNLKRRVPPPAVVPVSTLEQDEGFAKTLPSDIAGRFSRALELIRDGNFSEAIPLLQTCLDASVGQPFTPQIYFWLGISYEGLGDNRNALLAYNQIVNLFGKHQRVPQALLRQASVFNRLGDPKTARITLKKLVNDHPGTPEAVQASRQLQDLQ